MRMKSVLRELTEGRNTQVNMPAAEEQVICLLGRYGCIGCHAGQQNGHIAMRESDP